MDMKDLLIMHYKMYPRMQIVDMVKLIYQNEFAGGHLVTNEACSLQRLQEEWCSLDEKAPAQPLFENIGDGLCRLNLRPLKDKGINIATVNKFFANTANCVQGSIENFEEKLNILWQCCRDGDLPYKLGELEYYLDGYKDNGYPQVSHSYEYRAAYSPAYRVVKLEYCRYFEVFSHIDSLLETQETVNAAIDGNSGAGKSTLSSLIGSAYDCNIFHMDDFFLRPELKTEERMREVGGNVDYDRFRDEVIAGIKSGREFEYQVYDCKRMALGQKISVKPKRLNIIEGSYSMHPALIDNYDLKIFLHVDEEEQSRRILERNGLVMQKRFLSLWIPLENRYFNEMQIEGRCDLVFGR